LFVLNLELVSVDIMTFLFLLWRHVVLMLVLKRLCLQSKRRTSY